MTPRASRTIRCLLVVAACPVLYGVTCGSEPTTDEGQSPGGSCPGAPELYQYAMDVHKRALKELRFNATWDVTVEESFHRAAKLLPNGTCLDIKSAHCEDVQLGAKEWGSKIEYSFKMPPAPDPPRCDDLVDYQQFMPPEEAKRAAMGEVSWAVMEALGSLTGDGEIALGLGTSWSAEGASWTTHRWAMGGLCPLKNPCDQQRDERGDCPRTTAEMTTAAMLSVTWDPEEGARLDIDVYEEEGTATLPARTTIRIDDREDIDYKYAPVSSPENVYEQLCKVATASCKGVTPQQEQCPGRFYAAKLDDPVALAHTTHSEDLSSAGTDADPATFGTRLITLSCVKNCDCISASECDDANPCTKDSCAAGACVNAPDEAAVRQQRSPRDCTRQICEGGKPRDVSADDEVPTDDQPDDCMKKVCQGGAAVEQFDRSKSECECKQDLDCEDGNFCTRETCDLASHTCINHGPDDDLIPPEIPANCNDEDCQGGKVVLVPDDTDSPVDLSPYDCKQQYCLDGVIKTGPDDTEPGCQ